MRELAGVDPKPYSRIIEERAHDTPDKTFAIIPKLDSHQDRAQKLYLQAICHSGGQNVLVARANAWGIRQLGHSGIHRNKRPPVFVPLCCSD